MRFARRFSNSSARRATAAALRASIAESEVSKLRRTARTSDGSEPAKVDDDVFADLGGAPAARGTA